MKIIFCVMMIMVLSINLTSQNNSEQKIEINSKKLLIGEDLTYVVKYAFFNLGEIRFRVVEKTKLRGIPVYKTVAYIDSYPDLPFVSLHQIYESYMDSANFPLRFLAQIFGDEDTTYVDYEFYDHSKIKMKKGKYGSTKVWLDSTKTVNKRFQDGLSILYYARMNFGSERSVNIPCFVNEKEEITGINYFTENEPVEIDAVDYEVDCLYLDGETDFVSVYGLTGYFEGWFSNDSFSVPILAKMNVIIGSITLELKNWNKNLWNPPSYTN